MTKALCRLEDAPQYNIYKCWFYFLARRDKLDEAMYMSEVGLMHMNQDTFFHRSARYTLWMPMDSSEWRGVIGSVG